MGRTRRKRHRKARQVFSENLNNDPTTIDLRKWLRRNELIDPLDLQLRNFALTGRGVTSSKRISPLDIIMNIPFNLLITFDTICESDLICYVRPQKPLNIHTFLALFLIMEKHKGDKSPWNSYIRSFPDPEPLLPWIYLDLDVFPDYLKMQVTKLKGTFEESFERTKQSISAVAGNSCKCCGQSLDYLLDFESFKWAYVLVNTRAVYVDPNCLRTFKQDQLSLADEPILALCPFLDLINHHYNAQTKVQIVTTNGRTFYQLSTLTGYQKYEQIFISYGSHDNDTLLMQYGFFIEGNTFDRVPIGFKDVLEVLKLNFDDRQYKFIKNHQISASDIYINHNGVSFVLKAILFVGNYPGVLNYSTIFFSNRFPKDFDEIVDGNAKTLLSFKLDEYKKDLTRIGDKCQSACGKLLWAYLEYRVFYVSKLLKLLDENKLRFT